MKSMKSLNLIPTESSNNNIKSNHTKRIDLYPKNFLFKYSKFSTNRIIFNGNIKNNKYPIFKRNQYNHTLMGRNLFESKKKITTTFYENKINNKLLIIQKACAFCNNYYFQSVLPIFLSNYRKLIERNLLISGKIIIDSILYNVRRRIVALFKDFLIYDDQFEFFEKLYTFEESKNKLKKIVLNENHNLKNYNFIPKFTELKFGNLLWEINKKKYKRSQQKERNLFTYGRYSNFLNSEFRLKLEKDIDEFDDNLLNSEVEDLKLLENFSNISSLNFSKTSNIQPNNCFELKCRIPMQKKVQVQNILKPNIIRNLKQYNNINLQQNQVIKKKIKTSKLNVNPISSRNNEIFNNNQAFRIKFFCTSRNSNSNTNKEKELAHIKIKGNNK